MEFARRVAAWAPWDLEAGCVFGDPQPRIAKINQVWPAARAGAGVWMVWSLKASKPLFKTEKLTAADEGPQSDPQ